MHDLRSQLAAKLGATPPPEADPAEAGPQGVLHPDAHLDDPWLDALRRARPVPGAPEVPERPSLGAARMLTDQWSKALKKAGRGKDAKALRGLRDKFLTRRDKAAWSGVKLRFKELGLSDKAYRALKQGKADPIKALSKLERASPDEVRALGAQRLKALLSE